jgi:hypothetical protein
MEHDLGQAASRNPDMLPPRNVFERVLTKLYDATAALSRGNCLSLVRFFSWSLEEYEQTADWLSVLLALTFYMKSSAGFAYSSSFLLLLETAADVLLLPENRFLWGV